MRGDAGSVKLDVRDLVGHLDTTFRGWSATLAAKVRLVISRLVLVAVLRLEFHGRLRVVRTMFISGALHALKLLFWLRVVWSSNVLLFLVLFGLVGNPWPVLELC